MIKVIELIIYIIFISCWITKLDYKLFDKKLKKYILSVAYLLLFFALVFSIKMYKDINILWYLYYIPLLYMPTLYYFSSRYISNKENKKVNIVVFSIATILLLFVLTNNYHGLVFQFNFSDGTKKYNHNIIYFIIVFYILYMLIVSTLNLISTKRKYKKDIMSFTPLLPIVLGGLYTIFYILNIPYFIRKTNISIILGILFYIGIDESLKLKLLPNNINYGKVFKNSFLPITIISKNGSTIFKTNNNIVIPSSLLNDLYNGKIKNNYKYKDKIYEVGTLKNGFSIIEKDYKTINDLKAQLKETNKKLTRQQSVLVNNKELQDKILELKVSTEILNTFENKIASKKKEIYNLINGMETPEKEKLERIKLLLSYCKSISNLIISNYNNEEFDKEKLSMVLNELVEDNTVPCFINIQDSIYIDSKLVINIYDILFNLFQNIKNNILINITENKMDILIDVKQKNIKKIIQTNYKIEEKITGNETNIKIIFN